LGVGCHGGCAKYWLTPLPLAESDPVPALFDLLSDTAGAPDAELPRTGVGMEWERRLAAALIVGADYGTRCSTVVTMASDGAVTLEERTRLADGGVGGVARQRFRTTLPALAGAAGTLR
jgi:uncharacterized protein with NRDE domain